MPERRPLVPREDGKRRAMTQYELVLPALAVEQAPGRTLFSFAIDGKKLPLVASISRVRRNEHHDLSGYQRAESLAHIRTIRKYLESSDPILPNALVIAFDSRVRFERDRRRRVEEPHVGRLIIPVDEAQPEHKKPGWIVDGQQRSAAIRDADVSSFPVYVTAFITNSVAEQRSQFILVNSTKPLPKGLIHELLPATPAADLPPVLLKRRYPAQLLDRLNYDPDSPFYRRIRTPTTAEGTIKDNSILKMLAISIEDGALYQWFDPDSGTGDTDAMLTLLKRYWAAVGDVFPEAWNSSPRRSRLVHGVGILSLGCLMDEISYELREEGIPSARLYAEHLRQVASDCHWTDGVWQFSGDDVRRWNELQNTPSDIRLLTDHLIRLYRRRVRAGTRRRVAA
jgi:DGQHR domain-containing protein